MLASRFDVAVESNWLDDEIGGYSGANLPQYRQLSGQLQIQNPITSAWQPVRFTSTDSALSDDELRNRLTSYDVRDSVSVIEELLLTTEREGGAIEYRLSETQQNQIRKMLSVPPGFEDVAIRVGAFVDSSAFRHTIAKVRSRILDWAMSAEKTTLRPSPVVASVDNMRYDLFISHASEDKGFVEPLATALRARGLIVWYDRFVLKPGDSLSGKIDEGLRNSKYGVVIVSHHFFSKSWPESEYRALIGRQNAEGQRRIIPVWHDITRDEVASYSPLLLDIFAVDSKHGVQNAVLQIASVARPDLDDAQSVEIPEVTRPSREEEYDLAPYRVGDPGVPIDALPWQPYFIGQQPCLEVRYGEPHIVNLSADKRRWALECFVTNVGSGAARHLRLFMPCLHIYPVSVLQREASERLGIFVDDRLAFWHGLKPPLQTVFEYEDVSGILYRQYGTMSQQLTPGSAFYRVEITELGKPFRVKSRIVKDDTPPGWIVPTPE